MFYASAVAAGPSELPSLKAAQTGTIHIHSTSQFIPRTHLGLILIDVQNAPFECSLRGSSGRKDTWYFITVWNTSRSKCNYRKVLRENPPRSGSVAMSDGDNIYVGIP